MLRGHVACQCGGRRRVLSAINGEAARLLGALRQARPVGLCHGPQATWQQRVSASVRSVGKAWTRASTGPLLMPGSSSS
jgi:hypothetical protein